jgi:DNA-binding transcriptional ArsR family regulator
MEKILKRPPITMKETKKQVAKSLPFEEETTRKGAHILRALNNGLRQKILKLIHTHKCMNVTTIYIKLQIEQSVASQHLRILREADFVKTQRIGKEIYYSLNYECLAQVNKLVIQVTKAN